MLTDDILLQRKHIHDVLAVVDSIGEAVSLSGITPQVHPDRQVEALHKQSAGLVSDMLSECWRTLSADL